MKYCRLLLLPILLSACMVPCQQNEQQYAVLEQNSTAENSLAQPPVSPTATTHSDPLYAEEFDRFISDLSSQLMRNISGEGDLQGPIAVTTFVDLNNLYRTSPFGRYLAEALIGELQRAGLTVTEIRKTESILIKERFGEYSLSRDIKEIAKHSPAKFLLVGTYVVRGDNIFVNARLITNTDNLVVSSGKGHLRRNPFLDRMLWPSAAPSTAPPVTIPIKGFGEKTTVEIIPAGS